MTAVRTFATSSSDGAWIGTNRAGPGAREVEDAVRHQGMEVDVQIDGTAEALDRGDAAGPRIGHPEPPGATPLPGEEGPGEEVE